MSGPEILRRSLAPAGAHANGQAGQVLEAIAWPGSEGTRFRLFTRARLAPEAVAPGPGTAIDSISRVAGGLVLEGRITGEEAGLILAGREERVRPAVVETGLLARRRVLFGFRVGEPAEAVARWLAFHARHHGAEAALIVDRARPEEAGTLAAALAEALPDEELAGLSRLVIVEPGIPLGKAGLPAECEAVMAPDASGRTRLEPPPDDPWRAPLGEGLIHEALRWRFLARASAVAHLDASDLADPERPLFEALEASETGVLTLIGERIYPWRLRRGQAATFGDHVCTPFVPTSGHRRWAVQPGRLSPAAVWRLTRVVGAVSGASHRFYRAMGVRHPGVAPARLVPKSSLVERPRLLELAREGFGHRPPRPPAAPARIDLAEAPAHEVGPVSIVTCMRNEAPFILEWIAHHRAIGVDNFLVYTNDCDDGTVELLDLLARRGLVVHRANPFREMGMKPQHAALRAAEEEPVVREAGWLICMDVDEFINVHVGQGRLEDLFRAVPEANMIALTWRLFGNADRERFEDRLTIEQFTRCAPRFMPKPHQAWGFKTLFRNLDIYRKMGVHRPKGLNAHHWERVRWVNGSGRPMPRSMLRAGWRSTTRSWGYDLVTLNHYAVRSAESFLVKRARGRVNHVNRDQGLAYWFRMNMNVEEDRSILARRPLLEAELARLLADPEIRAAHETGVRRHREKIAALLARPDYRALFEALRSERMRRLSRLHGHFGAAVYLRGPECVPDEIVFRDDLPPDFFFTVAHEGPARH